MTSARCANCGGVKAERLVQQHLSRRVRDVILPADHMRNLHQRIVDHDGEVVGRPAVGSDEHRIADDLGVEGDLAADEILERDLDSLRHLEADDRPLARLNPGLRGVLAESDRHVPP